MEENDDDTSFLHSIPLGALLAFRNSVYTAGFLASNPERFVDTSTWVDIPALRKFVSSTRVKTEPETSISADIHVKQEYEPDLPIKREREPSPQLAPASSRFQQSNNTRVYVEDGHEVTEIFDSDEEQGHFPGSSGQGPTLHDKEIVSISSGWRDDASSDTVLNDMDNWHHSNWHDTDSNASIESLREGNSSDYDAIGDAENSNTVWLDDLTSTLVYERTQITRQCAVEAIEYVSGLPSYWPIPRERKAYVIDLSDPMFAIKDNKGRLRAVDFLIKNQDQDSWTGSSGNGDKDSKPLLRILGPGPDGKGVICRRSRLNCAGFYACELIEPKIIDVARYELDPGSLQTLVQAQVDSRLSEANSAAKHALIFFSIVHGGSCGAESTKPEGPACTGIPVMRRYKDNLFKNGKKHFVACTGWSSDWRKGHMSWSIPDLVKEEDLQLLFAGKPLAGFEKPLRCSRIVPAHIGGRVRTCKYPHTGDGKQALLERHECPASKTIWVPIDESIRQAVIVFNPDNPHNHPILPSSKASAIARDTYKQCITAAGIVGSTVRTIENARSTELILGTTPALFNPALQNSRVKRDLLKREKQRLYPYGFDLPGVHHELSKDKSREIDQRYIWSISDVLETGGTMVFTANSFLLSRIHKAVFIHVDTTFKRTFGNMNEWEVATWDPEVQRVITLCRVYSNRSDTLQYTKIFDELQRVTAAITKRPLKLKALSQEGTLIAIGVDLELAQVLGACKSFLPTNEPEHSKINVPLSSADLLAKYFIRACHGHAKRGILELKGQLSKAEDFQRIMNFMYIESREEMDEFSAWICSLRKPKIQAWWDHKVQNKWILPALVKCLSKIPPEDWERVPATTNVGEGQHHWTNINTGIQHSLLEAILTARECDERTAAEVRSSLSSGILKNTRNDAYTRMQRNITRASSATKKARETQEKNEALDDIKSEIAEIQQSRKVATEQLRALNAKKVELSTSSSKVRKSCSSKAESSSSGRVTGNTKQARAKAAAKVHTHRSLAAMTCSRASEPAETHDCNDLNELETVELEDPSSGGLGGRDSENLPMVGKGIPFNNMAQASALPAQLDPDSVITQLLSTGPNSEMLIDANSAFSVDLNDATPSCSDSFPTHWPGELRDVDMMTSAASSGFVNSSFKSDAYAIERGMHLMPVDVIPATTQPHVNLDSFVTASFDSLPASSASSDTFETFQMDAQPCIDSEVFANTGLNGPCLVTSVGHIPDSTLEAFEIGHNPLGLSSASTAHDDFWATADIEFLANYGRKGEGIP